MVDHMADVLDLLAVKYPMHKPICFFDWSSCHDCVEDGAPSATRMNAGYGGVRKGTQLAAQNATTLLADTPKLKKGTVQHLTFQEGECPFYDPDATDHIGKVKGLKQILFERGRWNADMRMKGIRKGQKEYDPASCMPAVLGAQEDFANVEPSLMVLVKRHGGVAIMLPKFHCEINAIELVWGRSKYWVRKHCKYTIACLRTNVSKSYAVAEDRFSLAIVQKFCRTVANFNEVYRDGLKGAEAVPKRDTFKSHRLIPSDVHIILCYGVEAYVRKLSIWVVCWCQWRCFSAWCNVLLPLFVVGFSTILTDFLCATVCLAVRLTCSSGKSVECNVCGYRVGHGTEGPPVD